MGQAYGTACPRLASDLLRLGIGYRLQEGTGKKLSASTLGRLRPPSAPRPSDEASNLRSGTQLIRTWHGRTISVSVEEDGFRFEGRRYTSLTGIARDVTGAGGRDRASSA